MDAMFVGREHELAALDRWFEEARGGRGSLVAVSGEAGIGKTRLLEQFSNSVSSAGGCVVWGRARDVPGVPPYWPWTEVLRALYPDGGPEFAATIERHSAAARVLAALPASAPDPARGASPSAWQLVEFLTEALREASARRPLVLVLDDAHWLDEASLRLLAGVAPALRDLPLVLSLLHRGEDLAPEHPLRQTLAQAERGQGLHRLELSGLDQQSVERYVGGHLGGGAVRSLSRTLFDRSGGNPYFLRELVALREAGPAGTAASGQLPPGIRDVLTSKLTALSEETRRHLVIAAVLHPDIELGPWSEVAGTDASRLIAQAEALIGAHILEESSAGVYRFVHALMRDAVLDGVSEARIAELHGRAARVLERSMRGQRSVEAARLAWHFREGARVDADLVATAFERCFAAAELARSSAAWEPAIAHYTSCLELLDRVEPSPVADRARLLSLRGSCYRAAGQGRAGYRDIMAATDLFRERGDWTAQARAAIEASRMWMPASRSVEVLTAALDAPGERDPAFEALLLARRARLRGGAADEEMTRARGLAGDAPADAFRAELLLYEGQRQFAAERFADAAPLLRQAFDLFDALGEAGDAVVAMRTEHDCYLLGGQYRKAKAYYEECIRYAHRSGQRVDEHVWLGDSGAVATMAGDLALARRRAGESSPEVVYVAHCARIAVAEYTDELDGVADSLPDPALVEGLGALSAQVHMNRARALWLAGDLEAARSELSRVELLFEGARVSHGTGNLDGVLQALGSPAFVTQVLDLLERSPAVRAAVWTSVDRMRGTLALRLGRLDEAERHLRRALDWCEDEDVHVEGGRCLADLAEVEIARGRREQAAALLRRAIERFRAFGAAGYERRAAARLDVAMRGDAFPAGLSAREVEVLRLVAAGRTNRQIAEALVLSPNTVANHVKHILNKTGLANRAEAAAFAVSRGLVLGAAGE